MARAESPPRAARPPPPPPPAPVGRGNEGGGCGRGRVKARRSPPPEGVTAYKTGAALGHWGCRQRGRSARQRRAEAIPDCPPRIRPTARDPRQNVGVQKEGPRPWQEAPRGEETGVGARPRGER